MSKLAELIRRATRREVAPIGFQTAARAASPSLLLLARTAGGEGAASAGGAGADAVLLAPKDSFDATALKQAVAAVDGSPVGVWLQDAAAEQVVRAREAGADYVVFGDENTGAEVLLDEKVGFVLSLDDMMTDTQLRMVEPLNLDALLVGYWEGALTVRRQLELVRLAVLARKPLLLSVTPDVTSPQLQALREAGVIGVIVDADRAPAAAIKTLKEKIVSLPPRRQRREERPQALVPVAQLAAHAHDEEDDEDA